MSQVECMVWPAAQVRNESTAKYLYQIGNGDLFLHRQ